MTFHINNAHVAFSRNVSYSSFLTYFFFSFFFLVKRSGRFACTCVYKWKYLLVCLAGNRRMAMWFYLICNLPKAVVGWTVFLVFRFCSTFDGKLRDFHIFIWNALDEGKREHRSRQFSLFLSMAILAFRLYLEQFSKWIGGSVSARLENWFLCALRR